MRVLVALFFLFTCNAPVWAGTKSPAYNGAAHAFDNLSLNDRLSFDVLLTTAGYWPAVPNVTFSERLFDATTQYQVENGLEPTGIIDKDLIERLYQSGLPLLKTWGFHSISHPSRGHPIWVPTGLGLIAERVEDGIGWKDPLDRLDLRYSFYPSADLAGNYNTATAAALSDGKIFFRILKSDFYVVSWSTGIFDGYTRCQNDPPGILCFVLIWRHNQTDLHMERVATLISGSFWASMTGAPFADIPPIPATSPPAEAASRPAEPAPQPSSAEKHGVVSGTGFFVNGDGNVVTNAHVVEKCASILVVADGSASGNASVVARDVVNDLAVLKTTFKPPKVAGLRDSIRLGEYVEAFGFPLSSLLSSSGNFTFGNVTALSGIRDDSRYLQISAPVQPGNSGGPLLDQNGNVVGVVSEKLNALSVMMVTGGDVPQNVNFAIKGNLAASFLQSNRIGFAKGTASQQISAPDLADQARAMSTYIECR